MMKIFALLASHNRRDKTLACLERLGSQRVEASISAVLLDDGSTDGTADAVSAAFPWVEVRRGDGSRYWNLGTRDAFIAAWRHAPDFYLWLNDDTMLDEDAVVHLIDAHHAATQDGREGIVVGSVRDPDTGETTYGGVRRSSTWFRPGAFDLLHPTDRIQDADTMNGNVVLIPRAIAEKIGVNAHAYNHGMGDFDYGFRAKKAGFSVTVAPGTFGTCPRNPQATPPSGPLRDRVVEQIRTTLDPKGLPPREWAVFMRRWGGPLWPVFFVSPYLRTLVYTVRPARPTPGPSVDAVSSIDPDRIGEESV